MTHTCVRDALLELEHSGVTRSALCLAMAGIGNGGVSISTYSKETVNPNRIKQTRI